MNKSIMMGRLVRDPEIRYVDTQKGEMAIANFRLAVDRKFAKEDGEKADFFFCCAYGWLAEFTEKYLVQGLKVIVSGRMENDNYKNKDGDQVYGVRLIAEEINFAESKRASEEHREERSSRKSSRKEATSSHKSSAKSGRTSRREADDYEEDYEDDYEAASARQKSSTGKSSGRRSNSSLIRAVMVDYASRDQSISVYANLTPEQVRYLYVQICQNVEEFSYFQQKIFKDSQNPGRGIVTCFSMCRHTFDAKGQKRRLPWTVEIQNGTGKLAHNKNGGQYCEKKSYEKERAVSVSLQDEDIFLLFARAEAVIRAFEQDALFRKRNAGNFQKLYQMLEKLILGAPDSPKKAA